MVTVIQALAIRSTTAAIVIVTVIATAILILILVLALITALLWVAGAIWDHPMIPEQANGKVQKCIKNTQTTNISKQVILPVVLLATSKITACSC